MSKADFLKLRVTIPPVEEQKRIGDVLSTADKEIDAFQEYLRSLKQQKKGLMQRLLTGQVRVQV
jgi:type I restriction enzyme S subunit